MAPLYSYPSCCSTASTRCTSYSFFDSYIPLCRPTRPLPLFGCPIQPRPIGRCGCGCYHRPCRQPVWQFRSYNGFGVGGSHYNPLPRCSLVKDLLMDCSGKRPPLPRNKYSFADDSTGIAQYPPKQSLPPPVRKSKRSDNFVIKDPPPAAARPSQRKSKLSNPPLFVPPPPGDAPTEKQSIVPPAAPPPPGKSKKVSKKSNDKPPLFVPAKTSGSD